MKFGDLRSLLHRGELPPLPLPEEQYGYAVRLAGERLAARAHRMRLAQWLVYAKNPLHWKTRKEIDPSLDPLLHWYASDVAEEAMRMYGNGDTQEDLRQARKDAFDADAAAAAAVSYAATAASYATAEAEAAAYTAYEWSARYCKHSTLLTNWLRAYLVRWIEEGPWWEVSS